MRTVDREKHEEKRRQILDAAKRCFVRAGFQGASISDICAEAGISPGHLYHYFAGKEAIIAALAESSLKEAAERFGHVFETQGAVEAISSALMHRKPHHTRQGKAVALEIFAEAQRSAAMAKVLQQHSQRMTDVLSGLIRKAQARGEIDPGLEPDLTAAVLIGVADGSRILAIRNPKLDPNKSSDALKVLVSRFLAVQPSKVRKPPG